MTIASPDCDVTFIVRTFDDEERIGHVLGRIAALSGGASAVGGDRGRRRRLGRQHASPSRSCCGGQIREIAVLHCRARRRLSRRLPARARPRPGARRRAHRRAARRRRLCARPLARRSRRGRARRPLPGDAADPRLAGVRCAGRSARSGRASRARFSATGAPARARLHRDTSHTTAVRLAAAVRASRARAQSAPKIALRRLHRPPARCYLIEMDFSAYAGNDRSSRSWRSASSSSFTKAATS